MALLWTLGVYLCNRHQKGEGTVKSAWKNMISPTSIALVIGLVFVFSGIKLPDVVMNPVEKYWRDKYAACTDLYRGYAFLCHSGKFV